MRTLVRCSTLSLGVVVGLWWATVASAASITVSPTSVPVGGTVTVRGDVLAPGGQPGCQVPGMVTLLSGAFAGQGSFMNQDVEAPVAADGSFSVQAHILAGVAPGTYPITGRCGGGNLGVQATLTVTPALPNTGSAGLVQARADGRLPGWPLLMLLGTLVAALLVLAGGLARRAARTV